jgi:hypothetical protein
LRGAFECDYAPAFDKEVDHDSRDQVCEHSGA